MPVYFILFYFNISNILVGCYRRGIHYSRRHFHSYCSSEEGVEGKQTEGFKGFICSSTSS